VDEGLMGDKFGMMESGWRVDGGWWRVDEGL